MPSQGQEKSGWTTRSAIVPGTDESGDRASARTMKLIGTISKGGVVVNNRHIRIHPERDRAM